MKKQAYTVIAMIVLVGSMAAAAQAQTVGRAQLIADIPFDFNVGNQTLPAGEYTVRQVNPASDQVLLQLKSKDGRAGVMLQTISVIGKTPESSKLIFHRYGNQYFLAQAWVEGDRTGLQAPKSRVERTSARELAGTRAKTETVALTSR